MATIGSYNLEFEELGKGAFGIVYRGVHTETEQEVAVKKIRYKERGEEANEVLSKMGETELEIFRQLKNHKNIVELFNHIDDGKSHWFIMELCDLGDLPYYLRNNNVCLTQKLKIVVECACAIEFMHSLRPPIVHRDIKPTNVLMKTLGNIAVAKVTDFGIGKIFESNKATKHLTMSTLGGTLNYMAPEFFAADGDYLKYQPSVDTFSLGLLFHVLLTYDDTNKDMVPASVTMLTSGQHLPYGKDVANAVESHKPMPRLFREDEFCDEHSYIVKLKKIITNMTNYNESERMKLDKVKTGILEVMYEHFVENENFTDTNPETKKKQVTDINKRLEQEVSWKNEACEKNIENDQLITDFKAENRLLREQLANKTKEIEVLQKEIMDNTNKPNCNLQDELESVKQELNDQTYLTIETEQSRLALAEQVETLQKQLIQQKIQSEQQLHERTTETAKTQQNFNNDFERVSNELRELQQVRQREKINSEQEIRVLQQDLSEKEIQVEKIRQNLEVEFEQHRKTLNEKMEMDISKHKHDEEIETLKLQISELSTQNHQQKHQLEVEVRVLHQETQEQKIHIEKLKQFYDNNVGKSEQVKHDLKSEITTLQERLTQQKKQADEAKKKIEKEVRSKYKLNDQIATLRKQLHNEVKVQHEKERLQKTDASKVETAHHGACGGSSGLVFGHTSTKYGQNTTNSVLVLGLKKNTSLATLKEIFSKFRISLAGDPVKNVTIDSEFGTAIVVFKDHAVAAKVINKAIIVHEGMRLEVMAHAKESDVNKADGYKTLPTQLQVGTLMKVMFDNI